MQIKLEQSDIQAIAEEVVKQMKPLLTGGTEGNVIPFIFDKTGLAEYLHVDISWISKNLSSIPHFKAGKYVRFKRAHIDAWIETSKKMPSAYLKIINKIT